MEKPIVKCTVSNCKFWENGNNCVADAILIEIDAHANKEYNMEMGHLIGDAKHQDEAPSSAATCCHTFEPKK